MPKGLWLLIPAIFIDGLQFALSMATLIIPGGLFIGMALSVCLSITVGGGLIVAAIFSGVFSVRLLTALLEVVPGVNIFPVWTLAVGLALWKANHKTHRAPVTPKLAANDNAPQPAPDIRPARQKTALVAAVMLMLLPLTFAHAQTLPEPIQFVVSPELPQPFERVVLEAQGVGSYLGDSLITWQVDGKTTLTGAGERSFSFSVGGIGSITRVRVVVESSREGTIVREFVFRPSAVTLVWEADTTVPPLYRGKALYSAGSPLRVVAYPTVVVGGSRVAASSLSFKWERGGEPVVSYSGTGRSVYSFLGDQLQPQEVISVDVYFGAALVARGSTVIPATPPQLLFYERDPLRGVLYDRALLGGVSLGAREVTLRAEPYYFSNDSMRAGLLVYEWKLGDSVVGGPESAQGVLTLRQTGEGAGQGSVEVSLQNNDPDALVQSASALLRIFFGGQSDSGLSSFLGAALGLLAQNTNPPAFCTGGNCTYTALEPLPGLPNVYGPGTQGSFTNLIGNVLTILLALGAIVAVGVLVVGGVTYMFSDVVVKKSGAIKHIQNALWAILILAGSWLILNTVNPQLVTFSLTFNPTGPAATSAAPQTQDALSTFLNNPERGVPSGTLRGTYELGSSVLDAQSRTNLQGFTENCLLGGGVMKVSGSDGINYTDYTCYKPTI